MNISASSAHRFLRFGFLASWTLACGSRSERSEMQPEGPLGVKVVDSVRLAENDSVTLARPAGLVITADAIYVTDNATKQVSEFGRDGHLIRHFGRRGKGPGEFESVGAIVVVNDSLLAIKNLASASIDLFDRKTARFLRRVRVPSRLYDLVADNGHISGGAITADGRSSVFSFAAGDSSGAFTGIVPSIYQEYPILVGPFGTVTHDRRGGLLVEAFEASNFLFFTVASASADSINLPILRRKGAQTALLRKVAVDTARGKEALFGSSIPMHVRILNDSIVALVHSDVTLDRNLFRGRYFLSLLDIRRYRVCLDIPLTLPTDPLPRIQIVGDTVFALVQHVSNDRYDGTYLVRYSIDQSVCPWNHVQKI
ncbi:MAG: 6-bladed beta-propeller [Gemmatimonadaceae bacterium]